MLPPTATVWFRGGTEQSENGTPLPPASPPSFGKLPVGLTDLAQGPPGKPRQLWGPAPQDDGRSAPSARLKAAWVPPRYSSDWVSGDRGVPLWSTSRVLRLVILQ